MVILPSSCLTVYWTRSIVGINIMVVLNLIGALLLGIILGYERSYRGRAAGMRTYGLVCLASAALTVVIGFPSGWYGGQFHGATGDPTRVIQGIVTGIGFLGAGVIMKDGLNIRGLTTAASIWVSAAVGILVGIGFYLSAIALTFITVWSLVMVSRLEAWLPSRQVIDVMLKFRPGFVPDVVDLRHTAFLRGYEIDADSLTVLYQGGQFEWHFMAMSLRRNRGATVTQLGEELARFEGVVDFSMAHARN
jgi:putative Mg2+ transporter-C (MgtC) family protein